MQARAVVAIVAVEHVRVKCRRQPVQRLAQHFLYSINTHDTHYDIHLLILLGAALRARQLLNDVLH